MATVSPQDPMMLAVFDGYLALKDDTLSSVTKLGGHPGFLTERNSVPKTVLDRAVCKKCGIAMFLLAQCYCPLVDNFNRMLYVFACNKAACSEFPEESYCALSVQCDFEDPALDDEDAGDLTRLDKPETLTKTAFPPIATAVEEEPVKEEIVQSDLEKDLEQMVLQGREEDCNPEIKKDELEQMEGEMDLKGKSTDLFYEKFRRRIARMPSQVMRYQHHGTPVFMNPERTVSAVVPPCKACGGILCMELQIMPTSIYFLKAAACAPQGGSDGLDFASVTVYTCAKACRSREAGTVVQEEHIFVEAPPTAAEERAARDGRMSLRETVTGEASPTDPVPGKARPAAAAAAAAPSTVEEVEDEAA